MYKIPEFCLKKSENSKLKNNSRRLWSTTKRQYVKTGNFENDGGLQTLCVKR
jgi:hypothetical protein